MDISSDYGVTKMRPPGKMIDHTLEESGLSGPRDKYGIAVLAIRRGRECILVPSKEEIIQTGDTLIVAGTAESLAKLHMPDHVNNKVERK